MSQRQFLGFVQSVHDFSGFGKISLSDLEAIPSVITDAITQGVRGAFTAAIFVSFGALSSTDSKSESLSHPRGKSSGCQDYRSNRWDNLEIGQLLTMRIVQSAGF